MENLYPYPCEMSEDCLDFLEGYDKLTFEEFCKSYCAECPYCVFLDIPHFG